MNVRAQFPDVHWIWKGGISFVYEVHPRIVVKIPKTGTFEREQFQKEIKIYATLSQHQSCSYIVQCFHLSNQGIFLEYMRDATLNVRLQRNCSYDHLTGVVTKVHKLEPLSLRRQWMSDLAHAVAFLESLNLAHGDLRPENLLLDNDRLKLSDFDCAAEIGSDFEACMAPYGRILGDDEQEGRKGSAGVLGPRTEQFAIGSIFYFINYGHEVYGDRMLTDNAADQGNRIVESLQNMDFPKLDRDPPSDNLINKCWYNQYATISALAVCTEGINKTIRCPGDNYVDRKEIVDITAERTICEDLENRGLLRTLASTNPENLGFPLRWYRQRDSRDAATS